MFLELRFSFKWFLVALVALGLVVVALALVGQVWFWFSCLAAFDVLGLVDLVVFSCFSCSCCFGCLGFSCFSRCLGWLF